MKRLGKMLLYSGGFLLILMLLMPKVNLYYLLEEQLEPFDIVIDSELVEDTGLQLHLSGGTVFAKKIEAAQIGEVSMGVFGLYNHVTVEQVRLAETFAKMFPPGVERIQITHAIWNPLFVTLDATGDFGTATASLSLLDRSVEAVVTPSSMMEMRYMTTLRRLEKDETGGYHYETRF